MRPTEAQRSWSVVRLRAADVAREGLLPSEGSAARRGWIARSVRRWKGGRRDDGGCRAGVRSKPSARTTIQADGAAQAPSTGGVCSKARKRPVSDTTCGRSARGRTRAAHVWRWIITWIMSGGCCMSRAGVHSYRPAMRSSATRPHPTLGARNLAAGKKNAGRAARRSSSSTKQGS